MDDTIYLNDSLKRLRSADPDFRVFGAKKHRYQLGRSLCDYDLVQFELANKVQLPEDYRQFLIMIGNGGAGPHYGLEPLSTFGRNLSKPFTLVKASDTMTKEESDLVGDSDDFPGVLEFCHEGCSIYSYLVVNGPTYGKIWEGREEFYPTNLNFGDWFKSWLELALRTLDNERLVPRLRVGMTRVDVLSEVGGEWTERPAFMSTIRYFEAADIPCQLELDDRDIVVNVRPWSFIAARPS